MGQITFSINSYKASSAILHNIQDWQSWANGNLNPSLREIVPPKLAFLPALQRRRLNLSAKLLFESSWSLLSENEKMPLVFASHNGELNRSFSLYLNLLQDQGVSPTSFGLSVHNANAGQWSMFRQDMHESTAISCVQSNWHMAVIEAYSLLNDGHDQVLLVCVDEPVNSDYLLDNEALPFAYAVSAIISRGNDWCLSWEENQSSKQFNYWDGLEWIKNMHLNQSSWTQVASTHQWKWEKQ